ncbi:UNVERIFIED_CONTAM: hypothetical protein RMT77_008658 [Armadillidium vulgare]
MGSCVEMNNTGDQNVSDKPALKATPAVRTAFDELVSEEGFLKSSEIILKYFASLMSSGREHEELSEDAKYIVKRLVTSLASRRMHIRQGCYTIFQVLLQLYPQILNFSWLFIEKYYRGKTQESLADYNMGHVLALGAIIRSGLAMEEELSLEDLIKKLLKMIDTKFVVGPVIGQFLVNLLSMYKDKKIPRTIWKVCGQSLLDDMGALSTPLLWLRILIARDEYIKDLPNVPESFQKDTYDETTYENVLSVVKKLFAVGVNITPMVEDYFKSLILYRPNDDLDGEDNLSLFFSTALTPALTSNLKNNVLLFNISQVALSHLTSKKSIEAVLSPNLMEMLVLSCKSDIDEVSASARGLFSAILQLLVKNKERDSKIQVAVIKRLVSTSKKLNLDSFTKTTVLQQASDNLSAESVNAFVKFIVKNFRNEADEKSSKLKKFEYAVSTCQWINRLMSHSSMTGADHNSWKAEQVSHLFRIAYLSGFNQMQQHQMLKDTFLKGLAHSSNNIERQASFITEIVQNVCELVNNEELKDLSKDEINLFISTSDKLNNLPNEGNETLSSGDLAVFKILYGCMSLGVFIDPKDCEELIEEIDQCYKNASKGKKKKKKGKALDKNDEKSEEPEWREVVMDLLLSLISKEESFWRKVATVIFINICHKIKPSVLSLLTDVINPEKDEPILEGKTNEDDMNQSSVDYEDLDDPDTSMEVDTEEVSESEEEELDESEGDEDEEKGDDEDKIGMINLKKEMQQVVGLPMESVELDSVPEEELENLDKKLGSLISKYVTLSNKRKKKIKFSKDETALMCFRTRVCDLLEILVKEAPSLDHILQVIKPILMAINNALEEKLQIHFLKKLRSLIVEVSQVKKFGKPSSVSPEELATYLNDIFAMAKEFSNLMKAEINFCCTFLVRSQQYLNTANKKESNVVMKAYADYLEKAFSETSSEIYDGPIHLETVSLEMVLKVLSIVIFKKNTRPFNKKKGLEMLKEILNNENAVNKMSKNLKVVLQMILREIVTAFDRVQQTKHVQSNYLTMLIEILKTVKKVFKSNHEMEDLLEWEKVINSVTNFCQRISLKDFKTLKKTIQSLTNINNFQAESCKEEKSNSTEDGDAKAAQKDKISSKKSKKKRKLEQVEEEEEDPEELNAEKEVGEETLNEEGKKEKKMKMKVEEENENDWEDISGEKKKKKKKKNNQGERRKQNEARLWINYDIDSFNFAGVNNFETET